MSFSLKDIIFKALHPNADETNDPNKGLDPQGNDRGTLQRYQEEIGEDYDTELQTLIENLTQNNLDPEQAQSKYLPLLDHRMGDPVDIQQQRKALRYAVRWYMLRGTSKGYEVMLSALGIILDDLIEYDPEGGFDVQNHTLDEPDHTLDTGCPPCSEYELQMSTMSGVTLTQNLERLLFNVINFNEPINAQLKAAVVDGQLIVDDIIIGVNVTSGGDLEYDNQYAPDTTLYLENDTDVQQHTFLLGTAPNQYFYDLPDGDLFMESPHVSHYSIDAEGDLIYTP